MIVAKQAYYEHYRRQWALLFALAAVFALYRWNASSEHPLVVYQPPAASSSTTVQWFLMLRVPAITAQYESGIDTMKVRYGEWLDGLAQAGFHPMKLSDIYDRLQHGQGVPEKTIVLVFDPGFRRTFGLVAPILQSRQWPAVWLTPETAMQHGHREYVTYHTTDQMLKSGWWDVGFTQADGAILLKSREHAPIRMGSAKQAAWSPTAGGLALNRSIKGVQMNRLNVISDWTAADLLNRVRVELPVERPVFLTKSPVQNLVWGVTTDQPEDPSARFDLQVAPHKRGLVLDWFGTRGIADAQVHGEARDLIGDFTMRLRWDEEHGNGISVLISRDELFVAEIQNQHIKTEYHAPRSGQDAFKADLDLQGSLLSIHLDGETYRVNLHTQPEPDRGLFQLFLVDRFRGTARANQVQMTFTPR